MEEYLDFDDILIRPEPITTIRSRKEIYPYDENGFLPIFTAPMFDVVGNDSAKSFKNNKIYSIIPRTKRIQTVSADKFVWYAYSLTEFVDIFCKGNHKLKNKVYALIDIANGHMLEVIEAIKNSKSIHGDNLVLMVGNIANPETVKLYDEVGCDYVRLSIGSGSGCLTSVQTAIGYPLATLITKSREVKVTHGLNIKLVLDGGVRKFSDAIKAIALGADYVMMGSTLNKALESEATVFDVNNNLVDIPTTEEEKRVLVKTEHLQKKYRGMSTKSAQIEMGSTELKTSEGVERINKVEYTLNGWCENFIHYLSSSMSYTNSYNLEQFRGYTAWIKVSANAYHRYEK